MPNNYFNNSFEEENKKFIPPDYGPSEDDEELDENIEISEEEDNSVIEEHNEEIIRETIKTTSNGNMANNPFGSPIQTPSFSAQSWGTSGTQQSSPWQSSGSPFGQKQNTSLYPGVTQSTSFGAGTQREQINRNKKVIFINFLDCIVETLQSDRGNNLFQQPRGLYDFKARLEVWAKLAAFGNPDRIYILAPLNLIPTTNGDNFEGWKNLLSYYSCALSSFLNIPYTNCPVIAQTVVGQPQEEIIRSIIDNPTCPINRNLVVFIGLRSGNNGISAIDSEAAKNCNIDYIDLNFFLNNMY